MYCNTGLFMSGQATSAEPLTTSLVIIAIGYGAVASVIPTLAGAIYDKTGDFELAVPIALLPTIGSATTLLLQTVLRWSSR